MKNPGIWVQHQRFMHILLLCWIEIEEHGDFFGCYTLHILLTIIPIVLAMF